MSLIVTNYGCAELYFTLKTFYPCAFIQVSFSSVPQWAAPEPPLLSSTEIYHRPFLSIFQITPCSLHKVSSNRGDITQHPSDFPLPYLISPRHYSTLIGVTSQPIVPWAVTRLVLIEKHQDAFFLFFFLHSEGICLGETFFLWLRLMSSESWSDTVLETASFLLSPQFIPWFCARSLSHWFTANGSDRAIGNGEQHDWCIINMKDRFKMAWLCVS